MKITVRQKRRSSKWFEASNRRKSRLPVVNPGWPRSKSPFSLLTSTTFTTPRLLSINLQQKSISLRALAATGFFTVYFFPILLSFDLQQIALSPVWLWDYIEAQKDLWKCLLYPYYNARCPPTPPPPTHPGKVRSGCHLSKMSERSQLLEFSHWDSFYLIYWYICGVSVSRL